MFHTELRNFDRSITQRNGCRRYSENFIPENKRVFLAGFRLKILEFDGVFHLFDSHDYTSIFTTFGNCIRNFFYILPFDRFRRSESRFMDFLVWRLRGDSREVNLFNEKSIGGTENRSDVVQASYVVENNDK